MRDVRRDSVVGPLSTRSRLDNNDLSLDVHLRATEMDLDSPWDEVADPATTRDAEWAKLSSDFTNVSLAL